MRYRRPRAGGRRQRTPALAILDIGLPDTNGFELFSHCAKSIPRMPAIFLTARSSEVDRVVGLELGADDYMAKPFSPRELVARVRSVLRRAQRRRRRRHAGQSRVFSIDDEKKSIRFRGRPLDLSRTDTAC